MTALLLVGWMAFSTPQTAASTPRTVSGPPTTQPAPPPPTASAKAPCRNPDATGKYRIGCGVTAPVVLYQGEPEYPEEARTRKLAPSGVVISLMVNADGQPVDIHVKNSKVETVARADRTAQRLLEDKMMEAVRHYRFKPATFQGKGVPVEINVEITINPF